MSLYTSTAKKWEICWLYKNMPSKIRQALFSEFKKKNKDGII